MGNSKHIIIDVFWVGFAKQSVDMQKEYYYEIFSMGNKNDKKRHAISIRDFTESLEKGNITILSSAPQPRAKIPSGSPKGVQQQSQR
jgi:hypothetical protein|tara:strand:+ start:631 stop:891 length:261 start_codon:yes stop_codon:yes gene_type:complete